MQQTGCCAAAFLPPQLSCAHARQIARPFSLASLAPTCAPCLPGQSAAKAAKDSLAAAEGQLAEATAKLKEATDKLARAEGETAALKKAAKVGAGKHRWKTCCQPGSPIFATMSHGRMAFAACMRSAARRPHQALLHNCQACRPKAATLLCLKLQRVLVPMTRSPCVLTPLAAVCRRPRPRPRLQRRKWRPPAPRRAAAPPSTPPARGP